MAAITTEIRQQPYAVVASAADQHLDFLDGIRALAALYVMLGHMWLQVWPRLYHRSPQGWTLRLTGWLGYGHIAVTVFILLSGFCLMLPVIRGDGRLRGGVGSFFKRRARRILLPYYFAMGLSLALIALCIGHKSGTHWDTALPITLRGTWIHLLLLQDMWSSSEINHVFWSIALEFHIYLLFPLLVWAWRALGPARTTAMALLIGFGAVPLSYRGYLPLLRPQYIGVFAMGMLAATLVFSTDERVRSLRERISWRACALITGGLALLLIGLVLKKPNLDMLDALTAASAASLLILIGQTNGTRMQRWLSWGPLVSVGGFSYSIYLIHAPLIQVVWQTIVHPLQTTPLISFALLLLVGIPLIMLASYAFYLACERPFARKPARA